MFVNATFFKARCTVTAKAMVVSARKLYISNESIFHSFSFNI